MSLIYRDNTTQELQDQINAIDADLSNVVIDTSSTDLMARKNGQWVDIQSEITTVDNLPSNYMTVSMGNQNVGTDLNMHSHNITNVNQLTGNNFEIITGTPSSSILQNSGTLDIAAAGNVTLQSDAGATYINSYTDTVITPGASSKTYVFSDIDIQNNQLDNCKQINSIGDIVLNSAVGHNVKVPTSALLMQGNLISSLGNGLTSTDAVNLGQLNNAITTNNTSLASTFLGLVGGALTGALDMTGNFINNLATPTLSTQAANKSYVDTTVSTYVPKSGATMTGGINMNSNTLTNLTTPINAQDAVTKAYVDAIQSGVQYKAPCDGATTTNLNATYTHGPSWTGTNGDVGATLTSNVNGIFTVDGYTPDIGEQSRILVKDQTTQMNNGIYVLTTRGTVSTPWVLTRDSLYDGSPSSECIPGDVTTIYEGTTNNGKLFIETAIGSETSPIDGLNIGVDPVVFYMYSQGVMYTAGSGLTLTGTSFSLTAPVSVSNGGTGVTSLTANSIVQANGSSALSGILPTSGSVQTPSVLQNNGTSNSFNTLATSNLSDVASTAPTNGQALIYSSETSKYTPGSISTSLASLSDCTITTPTTNQILEYNGSKWVNANNPSGFSFNPSYCYTNMPAVGIDFLSSAQNIGNITSVYPMMFMSTSSSMTLTTTSVSGSSDFYMDISNTVTNGNEILMCHNKPGIYEILWFPSQASGTRNEYDFWLSTGNNYVFNKIKVTNNIPIVNQYQMTPLIHIYTITTAGQKICFTTPAYTGGYNQSLDAFRIMEVASNIQITSPIINQFIQPSTSTIYQIQTKLLNSSIFDSSNSSKLNLTYPSAWTTSNTSPTLFNVGTFGITVGAGAYNMAFSGALIGNGITGSLFIYILLDSTIIFEIPVCGSGVSIPNNAVVPFSIDALKFTSTGGQVLSFQANTGSGASGSTWFCQNPIITVSQDVVNYTGISAISQASDVSTTGVVNGDLLVYNSGTSKWTATVPTYISSCSIGASTDASTTGVVNGDLLVYNSGTSKWTATVPTYISSCSIGSSTDVSISGLTSGQLLQYSGTKWSNVSPTYISSAAMSTLTDTVISSAASKNVIWYNSSTSKWNNHALTTSNGDISDIVLTTPSNNQYLQYESSQWVNKSFQYNTLSFSNKITTSVYNGVNSSVTVGSFSCLPIFAAYTASTVSNNIGTVGNSNASLAMTYSGNYDLSFFCAALGGNQSTYIVVNNTVYQSYYQGAITLGTLGQQFTCFSIPITAGQLLCIACSGGNQTYYSPELTIRMSPLQPALPVN